LIFGGPLLAAGGSPLDTAADPQALVGYVAIPLMGNHLENRKKIGK
jgi:hypothetical protein